ncbi:MAG: ABC transporter substrate-binding protein [Alphaproteobacteria bacterium]|nr:ABC transporter substrate-binding protein [Alphaproteobacteria bacterium]
MKKILSSFTVAMVSVVGAASVGSLGVVEAKVVQATEINAKTQKEAEGFVQDLGSTAVGVINRPKITAKEVQQEFSSLLKENFALESIARYSLGKNFRLLSEEEKKDFLECFGNMLVKFYSSRFSEYKSAKLIVVGSRQKSSKQVLVNSKIVIPNKEDISVVWSVYVSKGVLKVYDAIISDVSISNVQRSEFMSKISEKGLKKFLADFREKYKK